jgi:hypothetical protein
MYVVLYRWRLHPGSEQAFIEAWSRVSRFLLTQRGSLGSRLHRGADGIWYSYAQWPDAAARQSAFSGPSGESASLDVMSAAIAERLPELELEPCADFLVAPPDRAHAPPE